MKNTLYANTDNLVIARGKVFNDTSIKLPENWKDSIDPRTITVTLTPIGAHQNLIVKRADSDEVIIQSNGGIPIECYYHVYAETK